MAVVRAALLWICLALGMSTAALSQTPATDGTARLQSIPAAPGPLDSLRNLFGGRKAAAELLPSEQAFEMVIAARDANTLIATLTPTPGYYLYRDRISFSVVGPTGVSVASVALPQGKPKADPNFGTVQVYYHPIEALIALRHDGDAPPEVQLLASYQGCNEPLGVCYPPVEKTVTVAFSPIHFGQRGQRSD